MQYESFLMVILRFRVIFKGWLIVVKVLFTTISGDGFDLCSWSIGRRLIG
jgi:hypothetical protein